MSSLRSTCHRCLLAAGCLFASFPFPFLWTGIVAPRALIELLQAAPLFSLRCDLPWSCRREQFTNCAFNRSFWSFCACWFLIRGGVVVVVLLLLILLFCFVLLLLFSAQHVLNKCWCLVGAFGLLSGGGRWILECCAEIIMIKEF